ncbi:DUF928 domain-containing protein [Mucilaginibacter litoreus]|uniref:DUF928 domain-containing protein n=1 Tax=Mucilaginibacter litoreus TaxID=1048221 RepID=A0ABW3AVC6_9SPHI
MRSIVTMLSLLLSISVSGQITVNFIPELNGRNMEGLLGFQLINQNTAVRAQVTITVNERRAGTVLRVRTPEFTVTSGSTYLSANIARSSTVQFSQDKIGNLIARSRTFPQGDYDYCFTVKIAGSDLPPDDQCFSYTLEPFADMSLIEPFNGESICEKRPLMTWQPLLPVVPGASYQLVLAEVKRGQSPTEALNYNLPVINQRNLYAPMLPYPSIAPELVSSKKYAWQVTAYKDQTILSRSDVWQFTLNCPDSLQKPVDTVSAYRDVEDLARGNLYVAKGYLRFALTNPYGEQAMNYTVHPVSEPSKKMRGLGKISLNTGDNYIIIDLAANGRFRAGKYYILEIRLPNGTVRNLRFLYEDIKD